MNPQDGPPGEWGPNRASIAAMRLHKTVEAYKTRDLLTALVEAEELLDEDPDNIAALEILGDTELDLGHGREAELVFTRLISLKPGMALYHGGLAVSRFLSVDFEGSLEAGREALKLQPDLVEAIAYVGLSLERLGQDQEARAHLDRAAELDPASYPLPVAPERVPWGPLFRAALKKMPPSLSFFFDKVPVVWHQFPDAAVLRSVDPPVSPLVLTLYEGSPPDDPLPGREMLTDDLDEDTAPLYTSGDAHPILPRSLRIYRGNVCRFAHDLQRLVDDLAQAMVSEASDWLGIPFPRDDDNDHDDHDDHDDEEEE